MTLPLGSIPEPPKLVRANWLGRYLGVEGKFDKRLRQTLVDAMDHIDDAFDNVKDNFSGKVRKQQLAASKRSMREVLSHVFGVTSENVKQSRSEAAMAAVDATLYDQRGILASVFSNPVDREQYANSLRSTAARNVENVVSRTLFSERTLAESVWKTEALANHQVSQAVNRALARGDSAKDLANSVKHLINPDVPGGISYAAKRLGRTEINNAFHATAIKTAQDQPWVNQMEWNLSKRHEDDPGDECERYASQRYFDVERVPDKPHPNCRCYVTPKQEDYDNFEQNLLSGQYDKYLDEQLGFEPESYSASEEFKWPEGTTDRVKAAYEKAFAAGKTDIYPDKSWSPAEKKASAKLTVRLQNAALNQEAVELAVKEKKKLERIIDDIVPDSIESAANSKQVANYLTNQYEGLIVENFDYANVDTNAAKEIGEAFEDRFIKSEKAGLRTNLRRLRIVDDLKPGVNAEARWDGKNKFTEIVFNHDMVSNYSTARSEAIGSMKLETAVEKKWGTGHYSEKARDKDRPFYSTFVHEWGHVLDYSGGFRVSRGLDGEALSAQLFAATGKKTKRRVGDLLIDRYLKVKNPDYDPQYDFVEMTPEFIKEYEDWVIESAPSGYSFKDKARKNIHKDEIVAESYIEFMKNPDAKPMTKSIVQELYRAIKENDSLKVWVKKR